MLEILFIRPGSTAFDEVGRIKGSLDIPLSENGLVQADRLSIALQAVKLDCLYVAPCLSAQTTAQCIADRNFCRQRTMEWLRNLDHGLWQGKLASEVKRLQPTFYRQFQENPVAICPPGGETVLQAAERISAPLNRLVHKHPNGRIGLLIPDPLASIAQRCLIGGRLGDIWQLERDSGTLETVRLESLESRPELQMA